MVWRREIETKQPKHRGDQSSGLAQRQTEDRPQRQRRRDRQGRVARLAAARAAGLGLPRRNRGFREPDGQAPALAQRDVIGGPIRHSVPLLRDVMTAILVRFEWHGTVRGQERATLLYRPLFAANDRSVQQGPAAWRQPYAVGATQLALEILNLQMRNWGPKKPIAYRQQAEHLRVKKGRLMRRQPKAKTLAPPAGNRGFESTPLQRRVHYEPDFLPMAGDRLEDNVNPVGRIYYAGSTMRCAAQCVGV